MSETLRSFRRNAVHVRQALDLLQSEAGRLQVDAGYLTDEGLLDRYKRLSIPVRRALNPGDRASFDQALNALATDPGIERETLEPVTRAASSMSWAPIPSAALPH